MQLFAQKRTGDALPQQVQAVIETGKALVLTEQRTGFLSLRVGLNGRAQTALWEWMIV